MIRPRWLCGRTERLSTPRGAPAWLSTIAERPLARPEVARRSHPDAFDISGQVAFVPGLAERGARVAIGGRQLERACAVAGELQQAGHTALGLALDVHSADEIGSRSEERRV